MQRQAVLAAGLLTIMVTACGSSEKPEVVEQIVVRERGAPDVSAQAAQAGQGAFEGGAAEGAAGLVALGQEAFARCSNCHVVEAGAGSTAGPTLYGVVGRVAGSLEGYPYTDALAASEITWDEANLDRYLADPDGTVPGSEMQVGTVNDAETRAAIIAYLATLSE